MQLHVFASSLFNRAGMQTIHAALKKRNCLPKQHPKTVTPTMAFSLKPTTIKATHPFGHMPKPPPSLISEYRF